MTWTTRPRSEIGGLSVIVSGRGPLIVLIHGVGLRAEAWNRQIDALSVCHRVMAVDLPGHGSSPVPDRDMQLAGYSDAVARVLREPAMIVGHSMGAMIALDLATRRTDRVRGVVALNAIYRRSPEARAAVRARVRELDAAACGDPTSTLRRWFGDRETAERAACRRWLLKADPRGYAMAYRVFAQEDGPSDAGLASLACPALFITGSEEPNSTPGMSRQMAALAPRGRAGVVEGAAHMMPMTHAAAVNELMLGFAGEVTE